VTTTFGAKKRAIALSLAVLEEDWSVGAAGETFEQFGAEACLLSSAVAEQFPR
jgi:hypothetical protein